jgi:HD-GYP domain-containing protein (c-di-GMP phosphodiesterase class II)
LFADLRAQHDLRDIDRRSMRVEGTFLDVVRQWGESIESKDAYTQGHCVRVADLGCAIARRLGWDDRRLFWFRVGALLHDVGKIDVPAEILNKPGPPDE